MAPNLSYSPTPRYNELTCLALWSLVFLRDSNIAFFRNCGRGGKERLTYLPAPIVYFHQRPPISVADPDPVGSGLFWSPGSG